MKKSVEEFLKCIGSLHIACNKAGGNAPSLPDLKTMSALELIDIVSSNEIQFTYLGTQQKEK